MLREASRADLSRHDPAQPAARAAHRVDHQTPERLARLALAGSRSPARSPGSVLFGRDQRLFFECRGRGTVQITPAILSAAKG